MSVRGSFHLAPSPLKPISQETAKSVTQNSIPLRQLLSETPKAKTPKMNFSLALPSSTEVIMSTPNCWKKILSETTRPDAGGDLGFRVLGVGLRVEGWGFRARILKLDFGVWAWDPKGGLGLRL